MKKLAITLFVILTIFNMTSCDDADESTDICTDDSLNRTTNLILGDVLERCVDGKWYAIKECNDTPNCPEPAVEDAGAE